MFFASVFGVAGAAALLDTTIKFRKKRYMGDLCDIVCVRGVRITSSLTGGGLMTDAVKRIETQSE
ncbi:hypothetical protein SP41_76 [Salmonella phage 41]|nr:hypothetical protein SP41_76 [Salmonella phage 41]